MVSEVTDTVSPAPIVSEVSSKSPPPEVTVHVASNTSAAPDVKNFAWSITPPVALESSVIELAVIVPVDPEPNAVAPNVQVATSTSPEVWNSIVPLLHRAPIASIPAFLAAAVKVAIRLILLLVS